VLPWCGVVCCVSNFQRHRSKCVNVQVHQINLVQTFDFVGKAVTNALIAVMFAEQAVVRRKLRSSRVLPD